MFIIQKHVFDSHQICMFSKWIYTLIFHIILKFQVMVPYSMNYHYLTCSSTCFYSILFLRLSLVMHLALFILKSSKLCYHVNIAYIYQISCWQIFNFLWFSSRSSIILGFTLRSSCRSAGLFLLHLLNINWICYNLSKTVLIYRCNLGITVNVPSHY